MALSLDPLHPRAATWRLPDHRTYHTWLHQVSDPHHHLTRMGAGQHHLPQHQGPSDWVFPPRMHLVLHAVPPRQVHSQQQLHRALPLPIICLCPRQGHLVQEVRDMESSRLRLTRRMGVGSRCPVVLDHRRGEISKMINCGGKEIDLCMVSIMWFMSSGRT